MKNLRTAVLCVCLAYSLGANSQNQPVPVNEPNYNKPKLFAGLPDKIQVDITQLNSYFSGTIGQRTSLQFPSDVNSRFDGDLVSLSSKSNEGLQTAVVRSTNYSGASMTITRHENADGTVTYSGRIISFQHGDLFELKNIEGQWFLVKRNYYDLVNE